MEVPIGLVTYYRGAVVTNLIRKVLGEEKFLKALRALHADLAGKEAWYDTAILQTYLEEAHGDSLAWLFDAWVYGKGYPIYTVDVIRLSPGEDGRNRVAVRVRRSSNIEGQTFSGPIAFSLVTDLGEEFHTEWVDPGLDGAMDLSVRRGGRRGPPVHGLGPEQPGWSIVQLPAIRGLRCEWRGGPDRPGSGRDELRMDVGGGAAMTRFLLMSIVVLAWTSCDSGGAVERDLGADDASSSDGGSDPRPDGAIEVEEPGLPDTPADYTTPPDDTPPSDTGPEATVSPRPYIPAKSFRLEPAGWEGDAIVVHVVARDFDSLFGVALRIEWNPEVLVLRDAVLDPVFGDAGSSAIYKTAEVRLGSLALAWAFLGSKKEVPLTGDVRLATLKFGVVKAGSSPIAFFTPRCLALTRRLEKVESVYLSATVSP